MTEAWASRSQANGQTNCSYRYSLHGRASSRRRLAGVRSPGVDARAPPADEMAQDPAAFQDRRPVRTAVRTPSAAMTDDGDIAGLWARGEAITCDLAGWRPGHSRGRRAESLDCGRTATLVSDRPGSDVGIDPETRGPESAAQHRVTPHSGWSLHTQRRSKADRTLISVNV